MRSIALRYLLAGLTLAALLVYLLLLLRFTRDHKGHRTQIITGKPIFKLIRNAGLKNVTLSTLGAATFPEHDDIAVVTAFFDIGIFKKGNMGSTYFKRDVYMRWAQPFKHLMNPVIVYTDSVIFESFMNQLRYERRNKTKVVRVNRNSSWAFMLKDNITRVFSQPNYPKFKPNTFKPEYVCAQFAKYDVISRAIQSNYFDFHYYAWLDIGYFRNEITSTKSFKLVLPKGFNESRIAYTRIKDSPLSIQLRRIFIQDQVWVGGGLFLGHSDVIMKYGKQFQTAVSYFIKHGVISTDQQVIYGMYSNEGRRDMVPRVELQLYHNSLEEDWFLLGKLMRREPCDNDTGIYCSKICRECVFTYTEAVKGYS